MFSATTYFLFLFSHLMIKWTSTCDYFFTCNDHNKWQRAIKIFRKTWNIRNVQSFISCSIRLRSYFQEKYKLTRWYHRHWLTFFIFSRLSLNFIFTNNLYIFLRYHLIVSSQMFFFFSTLNSSAIQDFFLYTFIFILSFLMKSLSYAILYVSQSI
jgi:hypothetical protein